MQQFTGTSNTIEYFKIRYYKQESDRGVHSNFQMLLAPLQVSEPSNTRRDCTEVRETCNDVLELTENMHAQHINFAESQTTFSCQTASEEDSFTTIYEIKTVAEVCKK